MGPEGSEAFPIIGDTEKLCRKSVNRPQDWHAGQSRAFGKRAYAIRALRIVTSLKDRFFDMESRAIPRRLRLAAGDALAGDRPSREFLFSKKLF
jgi:hypothetical protein